jgi:hypothetical protein
MSKTKATGLKTVDEARFWSEHILRLLLEGITPIMTHNPQAMRAAPTGIRRKEIPEAEVEAEAGTYRCPDGTLGIPARCIRACLIGGAPTLKVGGRAASRVLQETIGFFPPLEGDELFPLEDLDGKPVSTYEIDVRPADIQGRGILRARPKVWPWRLRCTLKLTVPTGSDIEQFRLDLMQVANRAGQYPGLAEGRPQGKKGKGLWFGKFKVVEMEIEPLEE